MRYARDRAADEAVAAATRAAVSARDPRALARVWAVESRTLSERRWGGVDRLPPGHAWFARAQKFLDACAAAHVDPVRVVAALFDYARVQRRRGRRWVPSIASAASEFALRLHAEWERRQSAKAGGDPAARVEAARRLGEGLRGDLRGAEGGPRRGIAGDPPIVDPGATSARRGVVRRRLPPVRVPKRLDRDPAKTEGALLETLDRDAAAYTYRAEKWGDVSGLDLASIVEVDPAPYSPTFRVLAGYPLDGDGADALAHHVLGTPVLRAVAVARLVRAGVPAALFA